MRKGKKRKRRASNSSADDDDDFVPGAEEDEGEEMEEEEEEEVDESDLDLDLGNAGGSPAVFHINKNNVSSFLMFPVSLKLQCRCTCYSVHLRIS